MKHSARGIFTRRGARRAAAAGSRRRSTASPMVRLPGIWIQHLLLLFVVPLLLLCTHPFELFVAGRRQADKRPPSCARRVRCTSSPNRRRRSRGLHRHALADALHAALRTLAGKSPGSTPASICSTSPRERSFWLPVLAPPPLRPLAYPARLLYLERLRCRKAHSSPWCSSRRARRCTRTTSAPPVRNLRHSPISMRRPPSCGSAEAWWCSARSYSRSARGRAANPPATTTERARCHPARNRAGGARCNRCVVGKNEADASHRKLYGLSTRCVNMNTSDFLLERLVEWGFYRIYGYPGDGINGIMGAFDRIGDKLEFIQVRHEEMAAFMACAHAKFTGEIGMCLATSGPGAMHLLNGLYDAKMDHVPVVAIVGQAATTALGSSYQQEVDLQVLFKTSREYVYTVSSPAAMRHVVDRAVRTAKGMRAVTCVIVPKDMQEMPAVPEPPHKHNMMRSSVGYCAPVVVPAHEDLQRAADILNAGKRVAMLVGQGAANATDEVIAVAEPVGRRHRESAARQVRRSRRSAIRHRNAGLARNAPEYDMMKRVRHAAHGRHVLSVFGVLAEGGQARGVQIDIDARNVGLRYPTEVNLIGDSRETLAALLPLLEPKRRHTLA